MLYTGYVIYKEHRVRVCICVYNEWPNIWVPWNRVYCIWYHVIFRVTKNNPKTVSKKSDKKQGSGIVRCPKTGIIRVPKKAIKWPILGQIWVHTKHPNHQGESLNMKITVLKVNETKWCNFGYPKKSKNDQKWSKMVKFWHQKWAVLKNKSFLQASKVGKNGSKTAKNPIFGVFCDIRRSKQILNKMNQKSSKLTKP